MKNKTLAQQTYIGSFFSFFVAPPHFPPLPLPSPLPPLCACVVCVCVVCVRPEVDIGCLR